MVMVMWRSLHFAHFFLGPGTHKLNDNDYETYDDDDDADDDDDDEDDNELCSRAKDNVTRAQDRSRSMLECSVIV